MVVAIHDDDNDGGGDSGVMVEGVQGWEVREMTIIGVYPPTNQTPMDTPPRLLKA